MKMKKFTVAFLAATLLIGATGCSSMNNTGKGALIGTGGGGAVGAGIGALIGLRAIKVTFDGGILFPTGKYTLNPTAQADLTKFAVNLISNPDTDVAIKGYTDNTGSYAVNEKLSGQRANAVRNYLINCGVPADRLSAQGIPMADYVASNDTPEGRALNRRVEITVYANEKMIKDAEAQTASN